VLNIRGKRTNCDGGGGGGGGGGGEDENRQMDKTKENEERCGMGCGVMKIQRERKEIHDERG